MSNYGIPEELTYDNLSRLYPSVKQEYRKQPFNGSSFTSGDIQLKLNKMARSFLNPRTLAINFRVNHSIIYGGTAPAAGANSIGIIGNALSFFSGFVLKPTNGNWQEIISFPGLISSAILNLTSSPSDKQSMISYGFDSYHNSSDYGGGISNLGDYVKSVGTTAGTTETILRSYSIPIIGNLNCDKMIPLFVDEIEIDLTINAVSNFILTFLSTAGASYGGFSISDIEIVGDVLTLEEAGFNELLKLYPNGMSIKTESYLFGSSSLPAQAKGTYDITYPHGLNSLKKIIWWSSPSDAWEKNYAGVNPNLQNYQVYIGSTAYPQLPVKCQSVSEMFYQNQKSFGAYYSTSHSGSLTRDSFSKASNPTAGSKITGEYTAYTNAITLANSQYSNYSNKFYMALDLEQINQLSNTMYSGISTKGSSNLLRVNVAETLANVIHNISYYSVYDSVLTFDWVNQSINVST